MIVQFRTLSGKSYTLDCSGDEHIYNIKERISHDLQIKAEEIVLLYRTALLNDSQQLNTINYQSTDFITIHTPTAPPHLPRRIIRKKALQIDNFSARESGQLTENDVDHVSQINKLEEEKDIEKLVQMKFKREKAIEFYHECKSDFQMTVIALITGKIPQEKTKPDLERIPRIKGDVAKIPIQPRKEQVIDVSSLAQHQFGQLRPLVDGLSLNEKAILLRLLPLGHDDQTTVQIFIACEKDETIARNLLQQMRQ